MADAPYLVALALVDCEGRRSLPLTGRSLTGAAAEGADPGDCGRELALELLLRLWQRSEEGPLRRAAGEESLLLVEVPMQALLEQLPRHKASWLSGGSTQELLGAIGELALRGWRITIAKHEAVRFTAWPAAPAPAPAPA